MTRLHSKNIIVLQSSKVCIFPTGMMHESYKNRSVVTLKILKVVAKKCTKDIRWPVSGTAGVQV